MSKGHAGDTHHNTEEGNGLVRELTRENLVLKEELRRVEERSRDLIKYAPTGILEIDFDGPRFKSVNDFICQATGYAREELLAMDPYDLMDDKSKGIFRERIRKLLAGEDVDDLVEYTGKTKDGRLIHYILKVSLTYSNGQPVGAIIVGHDITEHKQAQALSDALNNINMTINASLDFNRIMESIMVEATKAVGFSRAAIALRDGRDWVLKYTLGEPQRPVGYRYSEGELRSIRELLRTKKPLILNDTQNNALANRGEAKNYDVASSVLIPLVVNDEVIGVYSFSDSKTVFLSDAQVEFVNKLSTSLALAISNAYLYERARHELQERRLAEEELKVAKQQAELYLDLMGHDINNLHQIALGYLELARDMPAGEEQARFLDKPVEVLQRSALLIQNVRKLQKLRDGVFKPEPVDLCEVLAGVRLEFGAVPDKRVRLNTNGHGRCLVHASELLRDVFANLVSNAIKHTGERADIAIDLDVVTGDGRKHCRVSVEDDGPGIPDDLKAAIFNRTLKGTNQSRGIGLGLYLVKSLVDSYGGRVWVEDRVKGDHTKGARFVVMFPAVE